MKQVIFIFGLILAFIVNAKSQPISNDTVICIIDTTHSYVTYKKNPFADRDPKYHWQISIRGHFYDINEADHKELACISFNADDLRNIYHKDYGGPMIIEIPKKKIANGFTVKTDQWINEQINLNTLKEEIGAFPFSKYNFVVFKQDLDNPSSDSVPLYRVQVGYCEFEK